MKVMIPKIIVQIQSSGVLLIINMNIDIKCYKIPNTLKTTILKLTFLSIFSNLFHCYFFLKYH